MPKRIAAPAVPAVQTRGTKAAVAPKAVAVAPPAARGWAPRSAELETLNQAHAKDREGGWNVPGRLLVDAVSKKGKTYDRDVAQANTYFKQAAADGTIDATEQQALSKLVSNAGNDGAAYLQTKHKVATVTATVATTAAAIGVTVATAGAGAPLIAVALAGGVAGASSQVLAKGAIEGKGYSVKQAEKDALLGGIAGVAGVATAGFGGAAASAALRTSAMGAIESKLVVNVGAHIIEGGVNGAVVGAINSGAATSLEAQTWKDGVGKGLEHVGHDAARGAAIGGVIGGAVSGTGALIKSVRSVPTPLADGPRDLSNYRSTGADQRAMKQLLGSQHDGYQELVSKLKAAHPELKNIPDGDLMGLRLYTEEVGGIGYREQNLALRTRAPDLDRLTPAIKTASSALDQMPSYKGVAYRGTHLSTDALAQYEPGKVLTERSFLSTTSDVNVAKHWNKANTTFVINAERSGKAISTISRFPKEAEVLFTPGTQFKVLQKVVDKLTGHNTIYLNEVTQ